RCCDATTARRPCGSPSGSTTRTMDAACSSPTWTRPQPGCCERTGPREVEADVPYRTSCTVVAVLGLDVVQTLLEPVVRVGLVAERLYLAVAARAVHPDRLGQRLVRLEPDGM